MTPEQCQQMIEFHKSHRHLTAIGDGSDYTGIRLMHIKNNFKEKPEEKAETDLQTIKVFINIFIR